MDPTTTLITFMLQTSPSVRSVQLIGSWDNFTKHYTMEKDSRRARGQWRGCYAFDNIIYDGDGSSPTRKGGLKMGHTYWYYYKVDGDVETHDPTLPSTTACPILPGQSVNFMSVPVEEAPLRDRSASMGSHTEPLKTMNPDDKYETPRPPPPTPKLLRLNTTTGYEHCARKRPSRSESPKSSRSPWSPRVLFGPKIPGSPASFSSASRDRGPGRKEKDTHISYPVLISRTDEGRKCVSLQDLQQKQNAPSIKQQQSPLRRNPPTKLNIPDYFAALDFDDEDDANFAPRSAHPKDGDSQLQTTILSPPPSRINSVKTQNSSNEHTPTLRLLTAASTPDIDVKSKPLPSIPTPGKEVPSGASHFSPRSISSRHTPIETPPQMQRTEFNTSNFNPYFNPKSHFSLDSSLNSLDEVVSLDEIIKSSSESPSTTPEIPEDDGLLPSGMISPTDSHYSSGCASPFSLSEYEDDDNEAILSPDYNFNLSSIRSSDVMPEHQTMGKAISPTRSEFQYNPVINEVTSRGFQGYTLPDQEYGSELTLRREITIVEADGSSAPLRSARGTFGGPVSPVSRNGNEMLAGSLNALLDDMSYLGDAINQ